MNFSSLKVPNEIASDTDNHSVIIYNMSESTVAPSTASPSKSKSETTMSGKVDKESSEDTITGFARKSAPIHENRNSFLGSWILKSPCTPGDASDVTQAGCSEERTWLQSAAQTTGDSDVESVISNISSFSELGESFTDLQLDADLQAIRNDIQSETEGLFRTLDDIDLGNEKCVPRGISVELRKRARAIVSIFGDDVPSLRCKIKAQEEEMGRLAAECNTSAEKIHKVGNQKSEEIKILKWRHHSEAQKLHIKHKKGKERHQKQITLLEEQLGSMKVDYPAYRALEEGNGKLRYDLEVANARLSFLETAKQANSKYNLPIQNTLPQGDVTLRDKEHKLCLENKSLEQENKELKQKIQTFEDKRQADIAKLTNIREKFEAVAIQIESMRTAKAAKKQPFQIPQQRPRTDARDQFAMMDRGEKYIINTKQSQDIDSTTKKSKTFSRESQSNTPFAKHQNLMEEHHPTNGLQTHADRRREEASTARNTDLSRVKNLAEHASICRTRNKENATLRDRVCELSAQLEHARIGSKCIRDALAERNEELKGFNDAKDKANWVLCKELVTASTQVETLGQQLRMQNSSPAFIFGSMSDHSLRSHTQLASQPCAKCPYFELELSAIRKDLSIHRREKDEVEKVQLVTLAEKKEVQENLKQANLKTIEFENEAIRVRHNYDNLAKNANERNGELEKILQATKKRLCSSLDETRSLARQITKCKTELESYLGVTYEKEGVTIHNLTRFFCLMSEQKEGILKQRVEKAEQKLVDEIERHRKFHAVVQKDVKDLIRKTGGLGSSTHELGKWAVEDFKEPST